MINTPRTPTTFRVLARPAGESKWALLETTVTARTQEEAKKQIARVLEQDPEFWAIIRGDGLEVAVTSARSFKPALVSVEPQPSKVTVRAIEPR